MGHNHHATETYFQQSANTDKKPWEPRTKIVAGILFVFGVITLNNTWLLAAALIFSAFFTLWGGLSAGQLLKKLSALLPFLALMSVPLIFGAGYPLDPERVNLAALILLKALTAMTFTIFIFNNQPIEEMLEAMEHLRVPSAITTVIYLTYRYAFLFVQEMQTTIRALKSRLFNTHFNRQSLLVYGELAGGLFIKSINRSEAVYRAMASRGFQGIIPVDRPRPINIYDMLKAALPLSFVAILLIIDKVVL